MATRTLTVVFTDLADYTASVGRADREGLRELVAEHERRVAPVVEARGGRIVKNLGDSYMVLFEAATDAAQASLELVSTLSAGSGFSIRVAMATGDVEGIDGDAFGEAVNLAARILSKTPSGEVWMSSTSRMCMNQTEVAWEGVGRFSLKGIAGETPVYRLVPEGKTWLPQALVEAARRGTLVRFKRGDLVPSMPPNPVILLERFEPDSPQLHSAVAMLPVVDPAKLFLQAHCIAPSDRYAWTDAGHGLCIGTPSALDTAIRSVQRPPERAMGTDTIILDMGSTVVLDLVMAGVALPAVPMSDVVAGYTYDPLSDGRWANRSDQAVIRVNVSPSAVAIEARVKGVVVNGERLNLGVGRPLRDGDTVETESLKFVFTDLDSKGYTGLLISATDARMGVGDGQVVEIGREPQHPGFALPDRRGQDNIRWCVGGRAARAREGGFTMDRALAGRRQAKVSIDLGEASLAGLHKTCPTLRLRGGDLMRVSEATGLQIGDMIVLGTSIISVKEPKE